MKNDDREIIEAVPSGPPRVPNKLEEYLIDLNHRSVELSLARVSDSLARCITLGTALAGGSLVLLKEDSCYGWWKVASASLCLMGLIVAIIGASPHTIRTDARAMATLDVYLTAIAHKQWYATRSMWFLVAGLAAAIIGAIIRKAIGG